MKANGARWKIPACLPTASLASAPTVARAKSPEPVRAVLMSARTGEGQDRLLSLIDTALPFDTVRLERFQIPRPRARILPCCTARRV